MKGQEMTAEVKHTPGPWELVSLSGYGSPFSIRMPYLSNNKDAPPTHYGVQSIRRREDAHLIAAAPELLLALNELLEAYSKPDERLCCDGRDCGCMGSTVHQQAEHYARAAIAKATGGQ